MKILVAGCGSIGKRHIGNLQAAGVEQIIACDRRADRLEEVKVRLGLTSLYEDYERALDEHAFDAVLIRTPPNSHIPIGLKAAQQGAHLFVEKPLAMSMDGVDELIDLCAQKGLVFMTAYCPDCVAEGTPPLIDGVDGRRTLEVILAARRSSCEGRVVALR